MKTDAPTSNASKDQIEIRELIDAWSRALCAKNLDGIMAGYANDVVVFEATPPHQLKGIEARKISWERCLPHFPDSMESQRRELEIKVIGDAAVAHCFHRVVGTGPDAETQHTWLRVTICYQRIDGKWMVIHEHVSVPFDPQTSMAAFIQEP